VSEPLIDLLLTRRSVKAPMLAEPGPTADQLATILKAAARVPDHKKEMERTRLTRAPTVVAVISRVTPHPAAPEWEQVLSCGAACMNLCLAANALGFGTCWLTEWYSFSEGVRGALGLAGNERIAGFIYIGTAKERQEDRERPDVAEITTRWPAT
jgi:nitroreductase